MAHPSPFGASPAPEGFFHALDTSASMVYRRRMRPEERQERPEPRSARITLRLQPRVLEALTEEAILSETTLSSLTADILLKHAEGKK